MLMSIISIKCGIENKNPLNTAILATNSDIAPFHGIY